MVLVELAIWSCWAARLWARREALSCALWMASRRGLRPETTMITKAGRKMTSNSRSNFWRIDQEVKILCKLIYRLTP